MRTRFAASAIGFVILLAVFGIAADAAESAPPGKIGPWRVEQAGMKAEWKIDASYPVFNNPGIDNVIKAWLTAHAASIMDDSKDSADADIPEMLLTVKIFYEVADESPGAVSILFHTFFDVNHAAHPSHTLNSFVFSPSGKVLPLDSLFADPAQALKTFSEQAPKLLADYYGERKEDLEGLDDWIARGTAPLPENYGCYTVEPGGIRVYFKEYQVAPYSMGRPDILIPLESLATAGPNAEVWPRR